MGNEESNGENTSGIDISDNCDYYNYPVCIVCHHSFDRRRSTYHSGTSGGGYTCGSCLRAEEERERRIRHQMIQIKRDALQVMIDRFESQLLTAMENLDTEHRKYCTEKSRLDAIKTQIDEEEKKVENFKYPEEESHRIVVIIGNTGDGKSTFCNRLSGDKSKYGDQGPFSTSGRSEACTQSVSYRKVSIEQTEICIVDTPGFNDGAGRDRFHANNVCQYLKGCGGINSFVLIRNSTNCRFDATFQALLKQYADIFGAESFFSQLIVIATRVDYSSEQFVDHEQAESLKANIIRLAAKEYDLQQLQPSMIKVIPIGLENYSRSICEFAQSIPSQKFECDAIRSPLSALREECQTVSSTVDAKYTKCEKLKKEAQDLEYQVAQKESEKQNL